MDEYLDRLVTAAERTADFLSDIYASLEEIRVDVQNLSNRVDELTERVPLS